MDDACLCPVAFTDRGQIPVFSSLCPTHGHLVNTRPPEPAQKNARWAAAMRWGVVPTVHNGEGEATCQDS